MDGDIRIEGDVRGNYIAIGHGARVIVRQYPPILHAPLRQAFDALIEERLAIFGGRDQALEAIAQFIERPEGGYLAVTAPAGFGKTALMATLVSQTPDAFAYHFFTTAYRNEREGDSLSESFFLRNVVQQMAHWHRTADEETPVLPAQLDELRALYHSYISKSLGRKRVLVLDGLDEVTYWSLAPYLQRRLPAGLSLIVTVRDVQQDWREKYGFPADQLTHLPLGGFQATEVAQVLRAAGPQAGALAQEPELLAEIVRVALHDPARPELGADPFYIRVLAEDAQQGKLAAERAQISRQPSGLEGYLDGWLAEVTAVESKGDDAEAAQDLIDTLALALGPINRLDLEGINPGLNGRGRLFPQIIRKLRRFVIGDDVQGYSLMHPRLRAHIGRRRNAYLGSGRERMLAYCANWAAHHSRYALAYYPQHLAQSGQNAALYDLIGPGWLAAKRDRFPAERAMTSFSEDALLAMRVARNEGNLVQAVRSGAVYATLLSWAGRLPPHLLGLLARLGQAKRALDYAALIQDPRQQNVALASIFLYQEADEAGQTWANWQSAAARLDWGGPEILQAIIDDLVGAGRGEAAVDWAAAIGSEGSARRPRTLAYAAQVLAQSGQPELAAQALDRATALAAGADEYAQEEVARALVAAGRYREALQLSSVGPEAIEVLVAAGRIEEALGLFEAIAEEQHSKARAALAAALIKEGDLARAAQQIPAMAGRRDQLGSLVLLGQALLEAGHYRAAAEAAAQVAPEWPGETRVDEITQGVAEAGHYAEALQVTAAYISDGTVVDKTLRLVPRLVDAGQQTLLRPLLAAMTEAGERRQLAGVVADVLVGHGQYEAAHEWVETTGDPLERTILAAGLVRRLAAVGQSALAAQVLAAIDPGAADGATAVEGALLWSELALAQVGLRQPAALESGQRAVAAAEACLSAGDESEGAAASRRTALTALAQGMVAAGQAGELAARSGQFENSADQEGFWLGAVRAALAAGRLELALLAVKSVPPRQLVRPLRCLAAAGRYDELWQIHDAREMVLGMELAPPQIRAFVQQGEYDKAIEAADRASHAEQQAVLSQVAPHWIEAGRTGQLVGAAEKLTGVKGDTDALIALGQRLLAAGYISAAIQVADLARFDHHRLPILSALSRSMLAEAGYDAWLKFFQEVEDEARQAALLLELLPQLLELGRERLALEMDLSPKTAEFRAQALLTVARRRQAAGQTAQARQLAAEAMAAAELWAETQSGPFYFRSKVVAEVGHLLADLDRPAQAEAFAEKILALGGGNARREAGIAGLRRWVPFLAALLLVAAIWLSWDRGFGLPLLIALLLGLAGRAYLRRRALIIWLARRSIAFSYWGQRLMLPGMIRFNGYGPTLDLIAINKDWAIRRRLMEPVVERLVDAGQVDAAYQALEQVFSFSASNYTYLVRAALVRQLTSAGHTEQALEVTQQAQDRTERLNLLAPICEALVEAGRPAEALSLWLDTLEPSAGDRAYLDSFLDTFREGMVRLDDGRTWREIGQRIAEIDGWLRQGPANAAAAGS